MEMGHDFYSLGGVSVKGVSNNLGIALRPICGQDGNFPFAYWLLAIAEHEIENITMDTRHNIFLFTCENGHLDVAQWLAMDL
jgi:hypothetical protein